MAVTDLTAESPAVDMVDMRDDALKLARRHWLGARAAIEALPCIGLTGDETQATEAPFWGTVDAAEQVILDTPARTPAGVAIKLRTALAGLLTDREHEAALRRNDLAYLAAADLDWNERMLLAALIDLDAMEGTR